MLSNRSSPLMPQHIVLNETNAGLSPAPVKAA